LRQNNNQQRIEQMKRYYQDEQVTLYCGDNLEVMSSLAKESISAIVTDPPYGLSFMGKRWDYDVPSVETWRLVFDLLKPGGHLLSFAGTRTQHRMAVNIEDAGFEIRDMIAWVYGSGFPKSLAVDKAIDKMDAAEAQQARRYRFTAWVRSTGVTSAQIDAATGTNMGGHYTTAASQPAIMTREHLEQCRHLLGDVPEWVEREADIRSVESKNFAEREVVGQKTAGMGTGQTFGMLQSEGRNAEAEKVLDITAPATDAAKQWQGWGTALKPALEPITVARKPFKGTVASNVLEHGTGGLNIDGCRVEAEPELAKNWQRNQSQSALEGRNAMNGGLNTIDLRGYAPAGRWPANLIHDGSDEVVGLFPETKSGKGRPAGVGSGKSMFAGSSRTGFTVGDSGSAARFFYCAKASKRDRNEGCDGIEEKRPDTRTQTGMGTFDEKGVAKQSNHHPTVKPTDLMAYLCRLITPPSGLILDPFMGSGSTGKAAVREGFRFIGIEQSEEYCEIALARIKHEIEKKKSDKTLFD
jgi:DNA modification methylase